jgi:hypothetical protein
MEEEDIHWDYGEDGDALATCLEIANNFDVNATTNNDKAKSFGLSNAQGLFIKLIMTLLMRGVHCSLHSILWLDVNLGKLNWTQKKISCKLQSSSKVHLPSFSLGIVMQFYKPN